MRYCPNCRRINQAWPQRCRFCGMTWNVRICRRGHENPPGAVFCGECGSADLTETAAGGRFLNSVFLFVGGRGAFPLLMFTLKLALPIILLCLLLIDFESMLPSLVIIVLLVRLAQFAVESLPHGLNRPFRSYYRRRHKDYKDRVERRDSRG